MKPPAWRSYDDDDGGGSDDGGSGSSPSTVNGGVTYELRYFKTEEQAREGVKQCGVIEMNSIRNVTGGKADDETSISLHARPLVAPTLGSPPSRSNGLVTSTSYGHAHLLAEARPAWFDVPPIPGHLRDSCAACRVGHPPPKPFEHPGDTQCIDVTSRVEPR